MIKKRNFKSSERYIQHKLVLLAVMAFVGCFTAFAIANTYEVIAHKDVILSTVITKGSITKDQSTDQTFRKLALEKFDSGSFGFPKKIKLPETKQHLDIVKAINSDKGWEFNRGLGQVFLADNQKQKVFGLAVIYLKYNTLTTQHLGDVLSGDIINIVTTDGWQLGYQVFSTSSDPHKLDLKSRNSESRILVIMVDDKTDQIKSFQAVLVKVGDRI